MMKFLLSRSLQLLLPAIFCVQAGAWNTPTHSSPSTGSSVWVGVTLDWNAVSNFQKYHLQVDTSLSLG